MSMFGGKSDKMSLSDAIKSSANQMLFRTLLQNPEKRAQVLELLTQEGIVGPDENTCPNKYSSPIKRLQKNDILNSSPKKKNNKIRLESPSALARKRGLQRLESSSSEEPSQKLPSPPFVGIAQPYDQILKGVVAYCEIRSNGEDRSAAIKTVMQSMGAKVKENLCTGVTHVVLKDGLYTTYRKAKLLKIHIVSVLWLEAVRKHKFKVPEVKFPAVCADAYDANLTKICQDMQKDYDEVIQDELNKSKDSENRRSEIPPVNVSYKNKHWRSTIHESCYKDPHNRTEIASPYKYIEVNPELSESDSYISVGSVDVVPSSQQIARIPTPESDVELPESHLVNAKNSFELEKASKIRSPESILKELNKKNKNKISLDPEDSLRLHVTTTDESNLNNTDKSRNSSKNLLEDISANKKSNITEDFNLHISEDNSRKLLQTSSSVSILSSDLDIKKTRRRTVGLTRSRRTIPSLTDLLETPKRKNNFVESKKPNETTEENEVLAKEIEKMNTGLNIIRTRRKTVAVTETKLQEEVTNIFGDENEDVIKNTEEEEVNVRKTRRKTLMNKVEDNINVRKSRRKTLAVSYAENSQSEDTNDLQEQNKKMSEETTTEDSLETELRRIVGENEDLSESTKKKTRRKTLANIEVQNEIIEENVRKTRRKTIAPSSEENEQSENEDLSENTKKKNRRKTLANTEKPNEIQNEIIEENVRKTRRKTIAPSYEENEQSENEDLSENTKVQTEIIEENVRKTRRKTTVPSYEENDQSENEDLFKNIPNKNVTTRKPKKKVLPDENEIQISNKEKEETSDLSTEKTKPRVRKLYDPNQRVSLSQINWDDEKEVTQPSCSPPKRGKYKLPLTNIPLLFSEKAKKKVRSTVKTAPKSVPSKVRTQETKKRKSAKVLTFSSSSETDIEKPSEKPKIMSPVRKSQRIAKTPKKNLKISSSTDLDSQETPKKSQHSQLQNEEKRRSTFDFVPQRSKTSIDETRLTQKKMPTRLPSIVCTRFHKSEVQIFQQIVKKLGGFVVEDEVSKRTTHLVTGGPARTINLLRGIARGCWIVKAEWLYKSLENGKWLEEEDYEMTEFSPAVQKETEFLPQKCRLEKQSFGSMYSMDLFKSCGPVFVSRGSNPRFSDLEELLELCGGRIVRFAKDAQIVVGELATHEAVTSISEKWILDSITQNKLRKMKNYVLRTTRSSPVL